MPTTRSRSALDSFSRRQMASAISAPTYSCWKKLNSPGAPSRGWRARGLPTSCSSAPRRRIASPAVASTTCSVWLVDVVLVEAVLRAADAFEQLGDHLAQQARRPHQLHPARRLRRGQQLEQLVADPLAPTPCGTRPASRGIASRVGGSIVEAQLRRLADGAHRPQPVLAEARHRIADRAHQPRAQIAAAVERIGDHARQRIVGDRVHREVAARQIVGQRLARR